MRQFLGKELLMKCEPLVVGSMLLAFFLCLFPVSGADFIPDKDCLECHEDKELTKTNATGKAISLFVDAKLLQLSVHKTNSCAACHTDIKRSHPDDNVPVQPVSCSLCHTNQSESYGASAHGLAMKAGKTEAAGCKDCHGTHQVVSHISPDSPLHFSRLAKTCGECHAEEAKAVTESVHGQGALRGEREAATCIDCHSEHKIETLKNGSSAHLAGDICGKCHASEKINTKFRMPTDRVRTFFESYHGLAVAYGSTRAANCASCHGVHRILRSTNPESSIHPNHLVETCGKCHPGANENFSLGKIHTEYGAGSNVGDLVNQWARRIYLVLIFATIGVFVLHNGMAWLRHALEVRSAAHRTEVRMDLCQRAQHWVLVSSFLLLAWTGFALKYPDSWLSISLGANEAVRRWLHRGAGVVLLVLGFYHLLYIALSANGRKLVKDFWPRKHDFKEASDYIAWMRGKAKRKKRSARFGYAEKMEYWSVVWGTVIMGVTGVAIWLKLDVTRFLPRWIIDVCTTVHYYEAILACLAILVWHIYHVIFCPEVYPMNWAWWDGKEGHNGEEAEAPKEDQKGGTGTAG